MLYKGVTAAPAAEPAVKQRHRQHQQPTQQGKNVMDLCMSWFDFELRLICSSNLDNDINDSNF